jgi:hypothetical protein
MCTLTWIHGRDGYRILFNRDELRQRGRGLPPTLKRRGTIEYIAPTDADAGGTWIAANAFGLTVCLLNHEAPPEAPSEARPADAQAARSPRTPPRSPLRSRGWIVDALADSLSLEQVRTRLQRMDPSTFRPFRLAAFDAHGNALQAISDGEELTVDELGELDMPLCSSSLDPARATAHRRVLFAALRASGPLDPEVLRAFHRSHEPKPSAWTPCMHRADAETVSHAEIAVDAEKIEFLYRDGPPCALGATTTCTLARASASLART